MKIRLPAISSMVLFIGHLLASSGGPPDSLIRENCDKALAVLRGTIKTTEARRDRYTAASFHISKVLRGPFKAGDTITYYSFKETDQYNPELLRKSILVFLVSKPGEEGRPEWGTATDLSEFVATPALEKKVVAYLRRQH